MPSFRDADVTVAVRALAIISCASLAAVIAYRTLTASRRVPPTQLPPYLLDAPALAAEIRSDADSIASILSQALRLRTISFETADGDAASLLEGSGPPVAAPRGGCACCGQAGASAGAADDEGAAADARVSPTREALDESRAAFLAFHALLERSFPRLHARLERHVVNTFSLLYVWRPRDASAAARPAVALAAHMDVVPVPDAAAWRFGPFAGTISDGFVHGRGAIDDKHALITICAAVEALLQRGFEPLTPVVLAFGHDEEIGGTDGAAAIAAALPGLLAPCATGARPLAFLLDEGLFLMRGLVPGVTRRVAMVCTGEKGHVNIELSVTAPSGHSSVPPDSSAIGRLARAVVAVEAAGARAPLHPEPALSLLRALAPDLPLGLRALVGNAWLTAPLLVRALLNAPTTAALVRTTTAVTMQSGGIKSNVMPPRATALVNHRIHPAESVADVVARDTRAAGVGVAVRVLEPLEPAPVARADECAPGWTSVRDAIGIVFDDAPVVAEGLMLGNTDTRHFWGIASDIYRHSPTELSQEETKMFHGRDEKVAVDNLGKLAAFYATLIMGGTARVASESAH